MHVGSVVSALGHTLSRKTSFGREGILVLLLSAASNRAGGYSSP